MSAIGQFQPFPSILGIYQSNVGIQPETLYMDLPVRSSILLYMANFLVTG